MARVLATGLAIMSVAATDVAAQRAHGCWRADRPLGPTGSAVPVDRDARFNTLVLRDSGLVALPLLAEREAAMWRSSSWWVQRGDTVEVRVFTGLNGWHARLAAAGDGAQLQGFARYLTDAIVVGAPPLDVRVLLTRIDCDPSWPRVVHAEPTLPPWRRGERLYFAEQVETPATLVTESLSGTDVVNARALRFDERATLDSAGARPRVGRVVVQFVIGADGRASTADSKVLTSDGPAYSATLLRQLPALRFAPATLTGKPVHQLAIWRFEIRGR